MSAARFPRGALPSEFKDALASASTSYQVAQKWDLTPEAVQYWRRKLHPDRRWPNKPHRHGISVRLPRATEARALLAEVRAFNESWHAVVLASRALRLQTSANRGG